MNFNSNWVSDVQLHVFFDCTFATHCWQVAGLCFDMSLVEDASSWVVDRLCSEKEENLLTIVIVLLGIWSFRNNKVWEGKTVSAEAVLEWSSKCTIEWQMARAKGTSTGIEAVTMTRVNDHKWQAPSKGNFKVNVDASVGIDSSSFSVGMILRDYKGVFMRGKTMRFGGTRTRSVFEAESIGNNEALTWILSLQIDNVTIETHSLLTVQALDKHHANELEVGNIIESCRLKLVSRNDFSFKLVRKQANRAAHLMARIPMFAELLL